MGRLRPVCGYVLLLRDAHHRILTVTVPIHDRLDHFDAILTYGPSMAAEHFAEVSAVVYAEAGSWARARPTLRHLAGLDRCSQKHWADCDLRSHERLRRANRSTTGFLSSPDDHGIIYGNEG